MSQQSDLEELSVDMDKLSEDVTSDDESSVMLNENNGDVDGDEDIDDLDDEEIDEEELGVEESKGEESTVKPKSKVQPKTKEPKKMIYIEKDDDGDKYLDMDDENQTEEDDSDGDGDDENHLIKFDREVRENYIMNFHPESIIHNYSEIQSLIQVIRDKSGMIIDPLHKTLPFLTKYEKTRIIGQRTKQLNNGSKPFVKVDDDIIDGYVIALKELEQKKIPFIVRRPLPNGGSEYWKLEDLQLLD
jgi:DNA-directed RNA polymerase I, II, and III subunit RPABC2